MITKEESKLQTIYLYLPNGNRHEMKVWDWIDAEDVLVLGFYLLLNDCSRHLRNFPFDSAMKSDSIH